ncbi:MAG TPA: DNA methyltransferase [Beijerinckiaceae bacterium]|nr:DNA methyltransferase [Beijerinckiaceae bacterium]
MPYQIEHLPVRQLKPYERNARTHSRKQVKLIARSIERFGFTNPILVDRTDRIIAGHGRVAAAKLLGMESVPAIRLEHLTDDEVRALVLADNQLALKAGWDKETLALELQGLMDLQFDVSLTGFEIGEIDLILEEAAEAMGPDPLSGDDAAPALADRVVSRPGDLWHLGAHRLVCGDARDAAAYAALMGEERATFVITDPPYNVPIQGHVSGLGKTRHREFAMASGEMSEGEFTAFLKDVFGRLAAFSVDGSIHMHCMDWRQMSEMLAAGHAVYTELKNLIVWNKTAAGMGTFYRSKHELVFAWKHGSAPHINTFELGQHGRHRANVWDYAGVNTFGASRMEELSMHPTVKPVALIADAVKDCSGRGDIVLDSFCGSGTILIACEKTGRRARAIEFDPRYVDVAVRRWQDHTGRRATLAATGESFEEVEETRGTGVTGVGA